MEISLKPPEGMARELVELVGRCYQKNPDKKDLRELEKYLKKHPQLYNAIFNLNKVVQGELIGNITKRRAGHMSIESNIAHMRKGLAYEQSPTLEKLLIDNVINCWLRLQWVELHLTGQSNRDHVGIPVIEYWERRMSANQRRYLRAIETLARVRKLTRNTPMLQVNIATQEGQQVNIAGDVVRAEGTKGGGDKESNLAP
jgi:hypothetical protein